MSDLIAWTLNGVDLDTLAEVQSATLWRPPMETRRSPLAIPGIHGELSPGLPVFKAPTMSIVVDHVATTTVPALGAASDALQSLLAAPRLTLGRRIGGLTVTARAELASAAYTSPWGGTHASNTIVLAIPGVWFSDVAQTSPDVGPGAVAIAHLAGASAPQPSAVLRITGPVSNPAVVDVSSGTSVTWSGTVPAGQFLFIDLASLTARLGTSSSAWDSGGSVVTSLLGFGAGGRLQLWPAFGSSGTTTSVSFSGSGTSSATKLAVRAARNFF